MLVILFHSVIQEQQEKSREEDSKLEARRENGIVQVCIDHFLLSQCFQFKFYSSYCVIKLEILKLNSFSFKTRQDN